MRCPACAVPIGPGDTHCPGCAGWLAGPQASELRWIEGELARLDAARTALVYRKAVLLAEFSWRPAAPEPERAAAAWPAGPPGPALRSAGQRRPELTARAVARLLLVVGAGLVVIAATAFTVANWAAVGPAGRLGILLAVTGAVLGAGWPLLRRGLNATAEATAAIGCALLTGDAYLARYLLPGSVGSQLTVVAAGIAVLACCFAAYGTLAKLTGPRLAAIVAAQLPGLILADALGNAPGLDQAHAIGLALVVTAGADLAVSGRFGSPGRRVFSLAAFVAGVVTWCAGVALALFWLAESLRSGSFDFDVWVSVTCAVAAADALVLLPRGRLPWLERVPAADATGGALAALALAIAAAGAWPARWTAAAFAAAGALLAMPVAEAARRLPADAASDRARLRLVAAGSSGVLALAAITAVPLALRALYPLNLLGVEPWTGPAAVPTATGLVGVAAAPVVLGLAAIVAWRAPGPDAGWQHLVAIASAGLAAGAIPAAMSLAGWAALAVLTASVAVLLALSAAAAPGVSAASVVCGGAVAAGAVQWSLTAPATTIGELATLSVLFGLTAGPARNTVATRLATAGSLAALTGLAVAVPYALHWPATSTGFAVLTVATAAIVAATPLRKSRLVHAQTLDLAAGPLVLLAAVPTVGRPDTFAVLTGMAALLASATAWLREGAHRTVAIL